MTNPAGRNAHTINLILREQERLAAELTNACNEVQSKPTKKNAELVLDICEQLEEYRGILQSFGYVQGRKSSSVEDRATAVLPQFQQSGNPAQPAVQSQQVFRRSPQSTLPTSHNAVTTANAAKTSSIESDDLHAEHAVPRVRKAAKRSTVQQIEQKAAVLEKTPVFRYAPKGMDLVFPEDRINYNHIVEINGKAVELSCPVCGANSTSDNKYFNGAEAFIRHVRSHRIGNLSTAQEIFEEADANSCLRELSDAEVEHIRNGGQAVHVRKPEHGRKHGSSTLTSTMAAKSSRSTSPSGESREDESSLVSGAPLRENSPDIPIALLTRSKAHPTNRIRAASEETLKRPAAQGKDAGFNFGDNGLPGRASAARNPFKANKNSEVDVLEHIAGNAINVLDRSEKRRKRYHHKVHFKDNGDDDEKVASGDKDNDGGDAA